MKSPSAGITHQKKFVADLLEKGADINFVAQGSAIGCSKKWINTDLAQGKYTSISLLSINKISDNEIV